MSVIVKGMKMPDCCGSCPLLEYDDYATGKEYHCNALNVAMSWDELPEGRREDCPLKKLMCCKDCKHWDTSKSNIMNHTCYWGYFLKEENDYCSWAKPKEEENK